LTASLLTVWLIGGFRHLLLLFNFNEILILGLSYLRRSEEAEYRNKKKEEEERERAPVAITRTADKKFLDELMYAPSPSLLRSPSLFFVFIIDCSFLCFRLADFTILQYLLPLLCAIQLDCSAM